jgi:hypothetical protein
VKLYCSHRTCSHCGQGLLFVFKNMSAEQLYLYCQECQHGWEDAEQWQDETCAFPAQTEDFESVPAAWHDIEDQLWQRYASRVLEQ